MLLTGSGRGGGASEAVGAVWAAAEAEGERVVDARMQWWHCRTRTRAPSRRTSPAAASSRARRSRSAWPARTASKRRARWPRTSRPRRGCRPAARPRRRRGLGRAAAGGPARLGRGPPALGARARKPVRGLRALSRAALGTRRRAGQRGADSDGPAGAAQLEGGGRARSRRCARPRSRAAGARSCSRSAGASECRLSRGAEYAVVAGAEYFPPIFETRGSAGATFSGASNDST